MGQGYECKCNKCGYSFGANLGVGFLFPMVYQKTVDAMRKGEYGEQGRKFFEEHPDGAIECDNVVARCTCCGKFGRVPNLTMYVPKKEYNPLNAEPKRIWSTAFPFEGADYVSGMDLENHYVLYEKYNHRCPECGGSAEIIDFEKQLEAGELKCPNCDGTMETTGILMWD